MILSKKDYRSLANIKSKLPRYCTVRKRKGYYAVYFQLPASVRPDGWKSAYPIGRTDKDTLTEIIKRGKQFYADFQNARLGEDSKPRVAKGSLGHVIELYKKSEHWEVLSPHTQRGYRHMLQNVFNWSEASGHPHISLMQAPSLKAFLDRWKDTPRTRKHYKSLMSKLFQVSIEHGLTRKNLARDIVLPKSRKKKKKIFVWTMDNVEKFITTADLMNKPNVGTAVAIAWESFRQTDVFDMQEPRDYRDGFFVIETSKTQQPVMVKARKTTADRLSMRPKTQLLLTINDHSKLKWTKNTFYHQFKDVAVAAGLPNHVFKQIRNSAAIHALKADLTDREYEQRFGWSKDTVQEMIKLYTDIDQELIDGGADKIHYMESRK